MIGSAPLTPLPLLLVDYWLLNSFADFIGVEIEIEIDIEIEIGLFQTAERRAAHPAPSVGTSRHRLVTIH